MNPYPLRGGFFPMPEGPAPETTGGRDPMQGGPAPPVGDPAADAKYQAWRAALPKPLQYEGDYNLRGFYDKNPNFQVNQPDQHLTDEFKLPNHGTFSDESRYADARHPGGHWNGDAFSPPPTPSRGFDPGGDGGPEQVRARAYATISTNPASEEAHAAREVLASLPKVMPQRPQPGSVDNEPDNSMMIAQYMRGQR